MASRGGGAAAYQPQRLSYEGMSVEREEAMVALALLILLLCGWLSNFATAQV